MRIPALIAVVAALSVAIATLALAQAPTEFEVASIKRNDSRPGGASIDMSRGQLRAINIPVQPLIRQAFEVMDTQMTGVPSWVATERYDVVAKAPAGMSPAADLRPLLRTLLAERFKLSTHRERRDMPVLALVRARTDRFGPGLRQSKVDCAAQPAPPPQADPADEWPACIIRFTAGRLYVGGFEMAEVLRLLTPLVGRTILDESGITGRVQLRLEFQPQGRGAPPPDAPAAERPELVTAIEEQLGLKLESRRAPVDMLVIDHIERPTPD